MGMRKVLTKQFSISTFCVIFNLQNLERKKNLSRWNCRKTHQNYI